MTGLRVCGPKRPSAQARATLHAAAANLIDVPPEFSRRPHRDEYVRTIMLQGWVPALGWEPLESRRHIDADLCAALVEVCGRMRAGEVTFTGDAFVDRTGEVFQPGPNTGDAA